MIQREKKRERLVVKHKTKRELLKNELKLDDKSSLKEVENMIKLQVLSKSLNILNLKKTPKDLKEVSKSTNASYLVDGNIMQIDNMLRVKVDLIDGKNISYVWSETYDRDLTGKNIFKLQDEITKQIINELVGAGAVLSKDINQKIASSSTDDISIYECINLARNSQTVLSLRPKAIECLKESVKKDPNYADAWVWLAELTRDLYVSNPDGQYYNDNNDYPKIDK